ncbi:MAG: hypothetical protein KA218_04690 [Arenimonas sp.]|nr:hypothetical protein [Arenimonas sp.]MBP7981702.1 hypothetical protein [Arenimonas sp.]
MIILRCTQKLLKRLRQPAKPLEPPLAGNPLGEWYADIDFVDRKPFVLLTSVATGICLILPGDAKNLKLLHEFAAAQLAVIFGYYDIYTEAAMQEMQAWLAGDLRFAKTADRSVLASMTQLKDRIWFSFAEQQRTANEEAILLCDGFYQHPSLGIPARNGAKWHQPIDLLRAKLMPSAQIFVFPGTEALN